MRFDQPIQHRAPRETFVPMINVVFLLLIFFLMTAVVATPPPFDLVLPEGEGASGAGVGDALFIGRDGLLAYETVRGPAVFDALAVRSDPGPLVIRADIGVPAARLAEILSQVSSLGISEAQLLTVQR